MLLGIDAGGCNQRFDLMGRGRKNKGDKNL